MCSSCSIDDHSSQAGPRRRRLNLLVGVLISVAGVVAATFAMLSLFGSGTGRATASPAAAFPRAALDGRDLLGGKRLHLSSGRPLIVQLWASACPRCPQAAATVERFAAAHPRAAVLGVDIGDPTAAARLLVRRLGWRGASFSDPRARLASQLGIRTLPTTLVLDRRGRVILRANGALTENVLERGLRIAG